MRFNSIVELRHDFFVQRPIPTQKVRLEALSSRLDQEPTFMFDSSSSIEQLLCWSRLRVLNNFYV